MIRELSATPLFGVALTLFCYALAQWLYRRTGKLLFNPVAVSVVAIMFCLWALRIPYENYAAGGRYVLFLLGPSVVALGFPLYTQRKAIMARKAPILIGIVAGAVTSIFSASVRFSSPGEKRSKLSLRR